MPRNQIMLGYRGAHWSIAYSMLIT